MKNKILNNESLFRKISIFQSVVIVVLIIISISLWNSIQSIERTIDNWDEYYKLATGPQGEAGSQGPQGETGPQGPQGETGSSELSSDDRRKISSMETSINELEKAISTNESDINKINDDLTSFTRSTNFLGNTAKCIDEIVSYLNNDLNRAEITLSWNNRYEIYFSRFYGTYC